MFIYISFIMKIKVIVCALVFSLMVSLTVIIKARYLDLNLYGYTIYVDAGHGGKDNGASYNDVLEDTINLNISKELINSLLDVGAQVYSSRDDDYDLASNYDKNRKAKDLKKRAQLINHIKPDLFLSIHLNTYHDEEVKGGQVFYQSNEESKQVATILQDRFNKLSNKDKKAKFGDYYLLNKTSVIGVIVECGFLTNSEDISQLVKKEYQVKIAKEITLGIYEYFINN